MQLVPPTNYGLKQSSLKWKCYLPYVEANFIFKNPRFYCHHLHTGISSAQHCATHWKSQGGRIYFIQILQKIMAVFEILSVILKFRNLAKMLFNLFKKFLETPGVVLSIRKLMIVHSHSNYKCIKKEGYS